MDRGPWLNPNEEHPLECETVQVLLADGATVPATWIGNGFWRGEVLSVVGWRRIERRQITHKVDRVEDLAPQNSGSKNDGMQQPKG